MLLTKFLIFFSKNKSIEELSPTQKEALLGLLFEQIKPYLSVS